jgi:hypothetical protein
MSSKKQIKVTCQGDTKRIKFTTSYETFTQQTRESFGQALASTSVIKFYYLDDENELISISNQTDF